MTVVHSVTETVVTGVRGSQHADNLGTVRGENRNGLHSSARIIARITDFVLSLFYAVFLSADHNHLKQ